MDSGSFIRDRCTLIVANVRKAINSCGFFITLICNNVLVRDLLLRIYVLERLELSAQDEAPDVVDGAAILLAPSIEVFLFGEKKLLVSPVNCKVNKVRVLVSNLVTIGFILHVGAVVNLVNGADETLSRVSIKNGL